MPSPRHFAVLVALGVIALTVWKVSSRDDAIIAAVTPEKVAVDATSALPGLSFKVPSLRTPQSAVNGEAAVVPILEERSPGSVHGRLYTLEGYVIPHGGVIFVSDPPSARRSVECVANAEGDYRADLRPGLWRVYYAGLRSGSDRGWSLMGELLVLSQREHTFDLYLLGDLILAGGFWHAELDELIIEVELRLAYDDSVLVAKGSCFTSNADYDEYLKKLDEEDPDILPRRAPRPPGRGGFLMRGLTPDVYELRAFLDVEKKVFITGRADLRGGDVQFTPIKLVNQDFFNRRTFELVDSQ